VPKDGHSSIDVDEAVEKVRIIEEKEF